ncbi:MAG: ABC transporter ATP-binding protein [Elusimicrobia bacterium]|nr:ABC transporter ATP-binding protein [Elusimicrobiota bacterium]
MLSLEKVYFKYPVRRHGDGAAPWVLEDISLTAQAGEFISVIGPSGCGKTTLLSLISGLLRPSRGRILDHGQEVLGPSRSRVLIFQGHLLFPWKTAAQNIEFVLKARGLPPGLRRGQALEYLRRVRLEAHADAYPRELSGGMQQRIGIARALAAEPDVLLLDEPFSSLDLVAKCAVIDELKAIAGQMGKTIILVTHNLEEAFHIGHRVYLLTKGPGRIAATFDPSATKPDQLQSLGSSSEFQAFKEKVSALMNDSDKEA